jgi:hypothetical protein
MTEHYRVARHTMQMLKEAVATCQWERAETLIRVVMDADMYAEPKPLADAAKEALGTGRAFFQHVRDFRRS